MRDLVAQARPQNVIGARIHAASSTRKEAVMRKSTEQKSKGIRTAKPTLKKERLKDLTVPAKSAAVKGASMPCGRSR